MKALSNFFTLRRRYYRSINLERDLTNADSVLGYVLTNRSAEILLRILRAVTLSSTNRAWTLTGAYGTGKSSFAHFLACLCGPTDDPARHNAELIAADVLSEQREVFDALQDHKGLLRAIATAQREPLAHTVLRAIQNGANSFWASRGRRPDVLEEINAAVQRVDKGKSIEPKLVLDLVKATAKATKSGLLLIIDELGKTLEFAAHHNSAGDLYLLQQLAELPTGENAPRVFTLGILHQAFAEYAHNLSASQRNEWVKIQGRFEDIPFTGSTNEMVRLIAQAIDATAASSLKSAITQWSKEWFNATKATLATAFGDPSTLASIYPLHPTAAAALPLLCSKYGQNDRSLFTFLTGDEPNSFACFLQESEASKSVLPTIKLSRIYDYWLDAAGSGLYSRPQLQRWVEIQGRVADASQLDPDLLAVLKTIGLLNLVSSGGHLRATRSLVALAMCDNARDEAQIAHWTKHIDDLVAMRLVLYRTQLDELRIWEGSDFDIEPAIQNTIQADRKPVEQMLASIKPLTAMVAQRHSYKTGTLRYFERNYVVDASGLKLARTLSSDADGLILYWLADSPPSNIPAWTVDGKPLIVIEALDIEPLRNACEELWALRKISEDAPELRTDGVARREVRQRLIYANRHVETALLNSFALVGRNRCWIGGNQEKISSWAMFASKLSDVCDHAYSQTPTLWNELINRRDLTSQGAKARGELLGAMISNFSKARLGLEGYGPECSMYASLLEETGIHQCTKSGQWGFGPPRDVTLRPLWDAIEQFCLDSTEVPRPINELYSSLASKPYGIKSGIIPVLLAAVLIERVDDVCIYKDHSFVAVLGLEHFELLVKDPSRFSVKHFVNSGLRAQVFKEIEELVRRPGQGTVETRNATLLGVVKPLVQFARQLPAYTRRTRRLSAESIFVREALLGAKQPDELLFSSIPEALGLPVIVPGIAENKELAREFRSLLTKSLRELQLAYDTLLANCKELLSTAFAIDHSQLREMLSLRARNLLFSATKSPLESFIINAATEETDERTWLERILMVIGDKPVVSWTDDDVQLFESGLIEFVRKFNNFEALQKSLLEAPGSGFDARRITLTKPSGQEVHRIVWIDRAREKQIAKIVDEIIKEKLKSHPDIEEAIISSLTERILQKEVISN